jgi:hypothetical protein
LRGDHELTDSDPARDGPPELVSGRGPTSDSARPPSARPIDGSEDGQPVFAAPQIPGSTVRGARAVMLRVDRASPPLQARICPAGKRGPKWLGLDLGPLSPPCPRQESAQTGCVRFWRGAEDPLSHSRGGRAQDPRPSTGPTDLRNIPMLACETLHERRALRTLPRLTSPASPAQDVGSGGAHAHHARLPPARHRAQARGALQPRRRGRRLGVPHRADSQRRGPRPRRSPAGSRPRPAGPSTIWSRCWPGSISGSSMWSPPASS